MCVSRPLVVLSFAGGHQEDEAHALLLSGMPVRGGCPEPICSPLSFAGGHQEDEVQVLFVGGVPERGVIVSNVNALCSLA